VKFIATKKAMTTNLILSLFLLDLGYENKIRIRDEHYESHIELFCAQSKERINMYKITIIFQLSSAVHKDSTTMKIWGLYLKKRRPDALCPKKVRYGRKHDFSYYQK
jgi:hypothetical protein